MCEAGVFFRVTDRARQNIVVTDPDNATHVREMIRRHYAGEFRKGKATKPFAKLGARVEETLTGLAAGSPRAIGSRVARSL